MGSSVTVRMRIDVRHLWARSPQWVKATLARMRSGLVGWPERMKSLRAAMSMVGRDVPDAAPERRSHIRATVDAERNGRLQE